VIPLLPDRHFGSTPQAAFPPTPRPAVAASLPNSSAGLRPDRTVALRSTAGAAQSAYGVILPQRFARR
jgi:hypothetical protein